MNKLIIVLEAAGASILILVHTTALFHSYSDRIPHQGNERVNPFKAILLSCDRIPFVSFFLFKILVSQNVCINYNIRNAGLVERKNFPWKMRSDHPLLFLTLVFRIVSCQLFPEAQGPVNNRIFRRITVPRGMINYREIPCLRI